MAFLRWNGCYVLYKFFFFRCRFKVNSGRWQWLDGFTDTEFTYKIPMTRRTLKYICGRLSVTPSGQDTHLRRTTSAPSSSWDIESARLYVLNFSDVKGRINWTWPFRRQSHCKISDAYRNEDHIWKPPGSHFKVQCVKIWPYNFCCGKSLIYWPQIH